MGILGLMSVSIGFFTKMEVFRSIPLDSNQEIQWLALTRLNVSGEILRYDAIILMGKICDISGLASLM